jgi:methyl-accepting chemotaxis protein
MFMLKIWNNISLSKKLVLCIVFISLIGGSLVGVGTYKIARQNILQEMNTRNKMISQNIINQFEAHLRNLNLEIKTLSDPSEIEGSFTELQHSIQLSAKNQTKSLSAYTQVYNKLHNRFSLLQKEENFDNFYLISAKGDILFSLEKKSDFGTNLITGEHSKSWLADVFKRSTTPNTSREDIFFTDLISYPPSGKPQTAYFAKPIYNQHKQLLGALIGELNMQRLYKLINIQGITDTATYHVDEENIIRSNSDKSSQKIDGQKIPQEHLDGLMEDPQKISYGEGIVYPNSYFQLSEFHIAEHTIRVVSERNAETVQEQLSELNKRAFFIMLVCVGLSSLIGLFFSKSFVRPILRLNDAVDRMLNGKEVQLLEQNRSDELGELARTLAQIYKMGQSAQQVQTALDNAQSPIVMLDKDLSIRYTNHSFQKTFSKSKEYLNKHYPAVNIHNLIGIEFSVFHGGKTEMFRERLSQMSTETRIKLVMGEREFSIIITPIFGKNGEREGFITEWDEKTEERRQERILAEEQKKENEIEEKISQVIGVIARGDFSARLTLHDNRPFIQSVAKNINILCQVVEGFIENVSNSLEAVAEGDLTQKVTGDYQGRLSDMQSALNQTIERIALMINEIIELGGNIQSAGHEIAQDAEDLSIRTESQATSIEETVATMEKISESIRMNAQNAQKANILSQEALKQAEMGGAVVHNAVSAMTNLEKGSHRITEIVSVIDSIASQTNLLALNAAVEAARAGEAGKGFAVVATEVRSLASRCSKAAQDIGSLITESNQNVNESVNLVHATGEALTAIVTAVSSVATTISSISEASKEQASGVIGITSNINQVDQMTQQNALLAEKSASASRGMNQKVSKLSQLVQYFKTGKHSLPSLKNMANSLHQEREKMLEQSVAPSKFLKDPKKAPASILPPLKKITTPKERISPTQSTKIRINEFEDF